jgi:hypothetical protein
MPWRWSRPNISGAWAAQKRAMIAAPDSTENIVS